MKVLIRLDQLIQESFPIKTIGKRGLHYRVVHSCPSGFRYNRKTNNCEKKNILNYSSLDSEDKQKILRARLRFLNLNKQANTLKFYREGR